MDGELADELGVSFTDGVYVDNVTEGGSAMYAGVLPRDIIIAVNGVTVNTVPDLQASVGSAQVGQIMDLMINRKGKIVEIPVQIKAQ